MLRGFRHTLFLMLQVGGAISGGIALYVRPDAWPAIAICLVGSWLASLVCERVASHYLRRTLGRLRRAAEDAGQGRDFAAIQIRPGDDFYKLVNSINTVATRLAEASSEQQRLHEQLRRRERLAFLGELAATVAHEVNNPLDGIQNCSRILRRSLDDPARARQMIDLMDSGLTRIDLIVRRLLTLAREHVIRPARFHLREVVETAVAAVREKCEQTGIAIRVEARTEGDVALVDPPLLEQVFVNLLINAADSMPEGGTIDVSVDRTDLAGRGAAGAAQALRVEVADAGQGIPADVLPHIFEPFYTTKQGGKGTGLGLAIAARIIDAHRGTIDVRPRENGGTIFSILLPAAPAGQPEPTAGSPVPVQAGHSA